MLCGFLADDVDQQVDRAIYEAGEAIKHPQSLSRFDIVSEIVVETSQLKEEMSVNIGCAKDYDIERGHYELDIVNFIFIGTKEKLTFQVCTDSTSSL